MPMKAIYLAVLALCSSAPLLAADRTIVVAADGSGDFSTVQAAVAAAPVKSADRTIIEIRPGTYMGPFLVPQDKPRITFRGAGADRAVLTWPYNVKDPIPAGWDKFNPGVHVRGDDFTAEHLTFENTSGDHGQALAMRIDGDRAVLTHCRLLGWQDTLMVNNGRHYF